MIKKSLRLLIVFYQKAISPFLPRTCRFHPSCSEYALIAIEKRGALSGLLMTAWRLLRCQPFSDGGHDPVLDKKARQH